MIAHGCYLLTLVEWREPEDAIERRVLKDLLGRGLVEERPDNTYKLSERGLYRAGYLAQKYGLERE